MKTQNVGLSLIKDSSNVNSSSPVAFAPNNYNNYCAITDSTSILIRLNSSKQAHAPADASPLKNLPTII